MSHGFTQHGKAAVIIDGQFGSTGKGLIAGYLADKNDCQIATTNASANAGHTTIIGKRKIVTFHMPTFAVINDRCRAYLNAGAIINPDLLLQEIEEFNMHDRLVIHPRAAVILPEHVEAEYAADSAQTKLASTRKGVGTALAAKVLRKTTLAGDIPSLRPWIGKIDVGHELDFGKRVVVEIPQGFSLGINSGLAYPHCTSRDVTVMQGMADALIHPSYLGEVMMSLRTFPIRVGNVVEDGKQIGWSGPCYHDQEEVTFEDLGVAPELTTVTKRVRRIFTWSNDQYCEAYDVNKPGLVFLNFVNYLKSAEELRMLINRMEQVGRGPTHFGTGPDVKDVHQSYNEACIAMGWVP
jgi:adenylosuccinate synthase